MSAARARILGLIPMYPPHSLVGSWISTHECLRHLAALGHQVDVVTLNSTYPTYELDGVTVHGRNAPDDLLARCDLVICHLGDDQGAGTARRHGKRIVRMAHGFHPAGARSLAGDSLAVFASKALRDEIGCDGPSVIVHPPVWADDYRTTPGHCVTLVNLAVDKGGVLFWKLARRAPWVPFLGVQGGYGNQVSDKHKNATVLAPTSDMRSVYSRTRILLMPSERETWGRVGVEAMCSGIPVIAHPTSGLRESLGPAGIFVDRADEDGWLAQIARLQDASEWAAASAAALKRASQLNPKRDLNRFTKAIEGLLEVEHAA